MKIALWFMDISQTLTCFSMADSDVGFIAVYSWHCLTVLSEDGIRASSMTIPASLQSSQSLFLVIWYKRIQISFSRREKGFLNDIEDLDFTCLSFLYRWNICYKVRIYRFRRIFESVLNMIVLYTLLSYTFKPPGFLQEFESNLSIRRVDLTRFFLRYIFVFRGML